MESLKKLFYFPLERKTDFYFPLVHNIYNILNTRSSLSLTEFLDNDTKLDFLYFGLPAFTHLSMDDSKHRVSLCAAVEKAIMAFESRLSEVEVTFSFYEKYRKEAKLSVCGLFQSNNIVINLVLNVALWEFIVNESQV